MGSKSLVEFKGTKDGIVVQLTDDSNMEQLLTEMKKKLTENSNFFKGANGLF